MWIPKGAALIRACRLFETRQLNLPESLVSCYEWKPSQDLLRKCKLAASTYNKEHNNKENLQTD